MINPLRQQLQEGAELALRTHQVVVRLWVDVRGIYVSCDHESGQCSREKLIEWHQLEFAQTNLITAAISELAEDCRRAVMSQEADL